ncbi:cytochrome P450 4V2-like, partial [Asbolus verrucosus]
YHWSRRHLYLFAAQLSGPPALPLIGNGLEVLCKKEVLHLKLQWVTFFRGNRNIFKYKCLLLDILLEDKNDHSIDYKDIPQIIRRCYNLFFTRITNVLLHFDIIYKKTLYFKEQNKIIQSATVMIGELMNTRVAEILKRLQDKVFKKSEARTPSMLEMIIEMVVENPNCFTEKDCVDHMMTFVATSQDTQSSIVGFTCMMLGIHPSIQDRVLKEIKEVIGSRTELDLTDVSRLKYLEMCIKESMRLFPVAPFIFRDTVDEFKLGSIRLLKLIIALRHHVTVGIGIYNIHRDPKYWERPEEYYPEHFTATAVSQRHPYAFLPFSAGPRKCIAQQYSYTNMKIFIATILLNYKLECEHSLKDIKLMTDVSIRPYHWSRRYLYLFAAKLPGPHVLPLVGNGLEFLCKKEDILLEDKNDHSIDYKDVPRMVSRKICNS